MVWLTLLKVICQPCLSQNLSFFEQGSTSLARLILRYLCIL